MTIRRGFLSVAILTATLLSAQASWGADASSWDGTWNGSLGKVKALAHLCFNYEWESCQLHGSGCPFGVQYTKVTPDTVFFGDQAHYSIKLIKTGDTTASAKVHGRHGVGTFSLTKG